jgi:serine/threonine protein kinase
MRLQALNGARQNLPAAFAAAIPLIRYIHVQPSGVAYVQDKVNQAALIPKWSMTPDNAASFCDLVRAILSVVHRAGLRHRDISPWNVLRSPLGAHLVDWDHRERTQGNLQWAVDAGMDAMAVDDIALLAADSEKADFARLKALQVWITKRPPPSYIA